MNPLALTWAYQQMLYRQQLAACALLVHAWSPGPYKQRRKQCRTNP